MKKIILVVVFCLAFINLFSAGISFPEFDVYSELQDTTTMFTSYRIDMLIDTGLKYGVQVGLGFKAYDITTLESNYAELSTIKIMSNPFGQFFFGYFLGKTATLGNAEIGYSGFQFHQEPHLEYIGYKDITGSGVETYANLFDNLFEPHIYIYQPFDTNLVNLDSVIYFNLENYRVEVYFGVNTIDFYRAVINSTLNKRFGVFLKTQYGKVDFLMGLFSPDSYITNVPAPDDFYLNVTEHIIAGYFEQTLSFFTRPSSYNGYKENISNDFDFYLSAGVKIEDLGIGVENTFLMSINYPVSDRAGMYLYFLNNSLKYKFGFYYDLMGTAFSSKYGGFVSLTGSL